MLTFLLVLLATIYLFSLYLRRTGMFFPDTHPTGRWELTLWMVQPTEHYFHTSDKVKLHGWYFRAQVVEATSLRVAESSSRQVVESPGNAGATTRRLDDSTTNATATTPATAATPAAPNPDAPVIVWCHGNAGNLTDRAEMAVELAKRGISVFLFDWRGFGRSEGHATEGKLFHDALAAHDYVKSLGAKHIVMYGESIGGPYAAWVAKQRKEVAAVIIENSFPSLREMGNALYHPLPLGWTAPFALRTTKWLNDAGVPVLVMHGTRDAVIPYPLGKKLFDGLDVPKEMLTANAGHCEIPLFEAQRYYATVTRFVMQRRQ